MQPCGGGTAVSFPNKVGKSRGDQRGPDNSTADHNPGQDQTTGTTGAERRQTETKRHTEQTKGTARGGSQAKDGDAVALF